MTKQKELRRRIKEIAKAKRREEEGKRKAAQELSKEQANKIINDFAMEHNLKVNTMPKKPYYFKFTGLPYIYSVVMAHTKPSAQMEAALYRDDAVCFEQDTLAVSFKHYHEQRFTLKNLQDIEQVENFKLISSFGDGEIITPLRKNKILDELIEYYSHIPGIKHANIITIGSRKAFGVKNSPAFIMWAMLKFGVTLPDHLPKEFKQKQAFIPICFFSVTKEKVEEKQKVKMLTDVEVHNEEMECIFHDITKPFEDK